MFTHAVNREIVSLLNHIFSYRNYKKAILEKNKYFSGPITKLNLRDALKGNIATCALFKNDKLVDNTYISGSFNTCWKIREIQSDSYYYKKDTLPSKVVMITQSLKDEFDYSRNTLKDKIVVFSPPPGSYSEIVEPVFGGRDGRLHDSERLLVNLLHKLKKDHPDSYDKVLLVTERIPCTSCTHNIIDFIKKHSIKFNIAYMLDSGSESQARDINALKSQIKKYRKAAKYIELCEVISIDGEIVNIIDRGL